MNEEHENPVWGYPLPIPDETYAPEVFWPAIGAQYESLVDRDAYRPQEAALEATLAKLGNFDTVLDLGCGFGRLGMMVERCWPEVAYTGVDISADQIANAQEHLPDGEFFVASLDDFRPRRTWDVVMCAEVLMHNSYVAGIVAKMVGWANDHVVICEWDAVGQEPNDWNFPHDYRKILGQTLVSAERVGVDYPWSEQSIFVARARY